MPVQLLGVFAELERATIIDRVVEPGVIQPTYLIRGGIPTHPAETPSQTAPTSASRAVTKMVDLEGQHTNRVIMIAGPGVVLP